MVSSQIRRYPLMVGASIIAALTFASCKKSEPEQVPEPAAAPVEAQEAVAPQAEPADIDKAQENTAQKAQDEYIPVRHPMARKYRPIAAQKAGLELNPLLTKIPNTSFFILASTGQFNWERPDAEDFFSHISTLAIAQIRANTKESDTAVQKAAHALFTGIFKSFSPQKLVSLGLAGETNAHFVFYFEKNTPVLVISLSDMKKFRGIVESYLEQNKVETSIPKTLPVPWTLIPLGLHDQTSLAIHWGDERLTLTVVGDDAHANMLLPDLLVPPSGKTAFDQLMGANPKEDTAVVGMLDIHALRNAFAALEGQADRLFGRTQRTDRGCVKEFGRITKDLDRISIRMTPMTGGSVMGFSSTLSFELAKSHQLRKYLMYQPQKIEFPRVEEAPMAQAYISVSAERIFEFIESTRDDIKREPFTCFTALNQLASLDDISKLADIRQISINDHHLGAMIYQGGFEDSNGKEQFKPLKVAFSYRSDDASQAAVITKLIESPIIAKLIENSGNTEESDTAADGTAAPDTQPQDAENKANAAAVYEDAKLSSDLESMLGMKKPLSVRAVPTAVSVSSDAEMLEEIEKRPLIHSPSILHLDMSERMFKKGGVDADKDRDFHVGLDVSSSSSSIDLTFEYVIE